MSKAEAGSLPYFIWAWAEPLGCHILFFWQEGSLPVLGGFGFWDGKLVGRGKLPYEQSRSRKPAVLCALNLGMGRTIGLPLCIFSCILITIYCLYIGWGCWPCGCCFLNQALKPFHSLSMKLVWNWLRGVGGTTPWGRVATRALAGSGAASSATLANCLW